MHGDPSVWAAAAREFEPSPYGDLQWSRNGSRCFTRQTAEGAELTIAGPNGALVYQLVGVDLEDLA